MKEAETAQESPGPGQEARQNFPTGLRIAIGFLDAFYFCMCIVAILVGGWGLLSLLFIVLDPNSPSALGDAAAVLAVCLMVFATMKGADWMGRFLSTRHTSTGMVPREPPHPLRTIALPLLFATSAYSIVAILCWIVVMIFSNRDPGWIWPLFWLGLWAGSFFLSRRIHRKTPLWVRASPVWIGNKDRRM